jgi:predicted  nucleic acid-binding Zn-ribbon protein
MPTTFFGIDPTLLTLAAIFGTMALTLGAAIAWGIYQLRADRLPAATRHDDIRERLAVKQAELVQVQARIHELDQKMHDRDRLVAEIEAMQRRIDDVRLEHENLTSAREEIAVVKAEAAESAQEKARLEQELLSLRQQSDALKSELDPAQIARLRHEKEDAEREFNRVRGELDRVRPELESAVKSVAEARSAEARVEALKVEAEGLRDEISRLIADLEPLSSELDAARAAHAEARRGRDLADQERELAQRQRAKLDAEVATLETLRDKLAKEVLGIGTKGVGPEEPTEDQRKAMLADLVALPDCLKSPEVIRAARPNEAEALHNVARYLKDCGLAFNRRTLHAFHTALKINDAAQLTILSGVSGTGKSLLPRRYAEAMGIHFLQVAVEPRWDSPQDLLGFYNYVEQKYRATELARLLAHLDPWRSLNLPNGSPERRDHMALVLLDEMNLARVEYYFSEFLSRLEARPAWRPNPVPEACKDAMIPVDIRGLKEAPRLFPAHNVLFVGTMNDDESTQSLSDKVLDRGNVLQFPAPSDFPIAAKGQGDLASEAQGFREWRNWVRATETVQGASADLTKETIGQLAEIMQGFGRPFGHRLNQAIRAYVANYPVEGNAGLDVRLPLADQIEFRILPKLRGVEIDPHRERFERLEQFIRTRLDDARLAEQLADTREDQARGSGLFVWRGLMRGE